MYIMPSKKGQKCLSVKTTRHKFAWKSLHGAAMSNGPEVEFGVKLHLNLYSFLRQLVNNEYACHAGMFVSAFY